MSMKRDENAGRRGAGNILLLTTIGLVVAAAAGAGLARYLASGPGPAGELEDVGESDAPAARESAFVPFGAVVVNLAEGRLTRYLKVNVTLQVEKGAEEDLKKVLENGEKAVFTHWLITHLSGLKLEEVKGSESVNRLRRQIHSGFNEILEDKGDLEIQHVFFEEFNVQ
jgi:flagellar basal body-associated protein FliL